MKYSLEISDTAQRDLDSIWDYVAEHDEAAADRQLDRIDELIMRLGKMPFIGRVRPDLGPHLRGFTKDDYVILYRVDEEAAIVQIVRIVHGRRDIAALFDNN